MSLKGMFVAGVTAALIAGSVAPSSAAPILFQDEAAWLAAVAGQTITTEGFEASPEGTLAIGTTDIGLFDVTIAGGNAFANIGLAQFPGSLPTDVLGVWLDPSDTTSMTWSGFDTPGLTGIGFDLGLFDVDGFSLTVQFAGTVFDLTANGQAFLGVVDLAGISSLVFSSTNEFVDFDNIRLAAVPVPAALPLMGTGLAVLGLLGWRRKRVAPAAV